MLFGHQRLGFSGTPSDMLPMDFGTCGYERGSEGKMLHVLTSPEVVSVTFAPSDWTVDTLLAQIAEASPHFNALIDSGALITGLSNECVARKLLTYVALEWCEGVVFIDDSDERVIVVKATGRVLKLSQCGIAIDKRFAFYDQIHTTGMDVKHTQNAKAVLTLGKDMCFRDYAQGAFRMRGIGEGQTLSILVIPEVSELMRRELSKLSGRAVQQNLLNDISAWLIINSMRAERLQHDQLCAQNLACIWRSNAWNIVMAEHERFKAQHDAAQRHNLEVLGSAFVSIAKGNCSSAKLEGKVIGLYFDAHTNEPSHPKLLPALLKLYETLDKTCNVSHSWSLTRAPPSPLRPPPSPHSSTSDTPLRYTTASHMIAGTCLRLIGSQPCSLRRMLP